MHHEGEAGAGLHARSLRSCWQRRQLGFVLELKRAVGGADGDGERVAAGALGKVGGLNGVGEELFDILFVFGGIKADDIFFNPAQHAELRLDDDADGVGVVGAFLGDLDVVLVVMVAAVDHDGGVAVVAAGLYEIDGVAVVAVDGDGDFGVVFDGGIDDGLQVPDVGVFCGHPWKSAGCRELFFDGAGLDDGLVKFHIVDVEGSDGKAARVGQIEHRFGGHQRHRAPFHPKKQGKTQKFPTGYRGIMVSDIRRGANKTEPPAEWCLQ